MCFKLFCLIFVNSIINAEVLTNEDSDIIINADTLDYKIEKQEAIARKNVKVDYKAKNGNVNIKSDTLIAKFDKKGKLLKADFIDNVTIKNNKMQITADKCEQDFIKDIALCYGDDVVIIDSNCNEISGTKANKDFNNGSFSVKADNKQVFSKIYRSKIKRKS